MAYYTPILSSILQSSIVLEDVETRWLWTVMLILADQSREAQGVVDCPIDRLAQIANLSVEKTRASIEHLCSPDPSSRSKTSAGARLVVVGHQDGFEDRKWRIINWKLYKKRVRQIQVNAAVRRHREREALKADVIKGNQAQPDSNPLTPSLAPSPDATEKKPRRGSVGFAPPALVEVEDYWQKAGLKGDYHQFWDHYEANGWRLKNGPMKNWQAACREWSRNERKYAPAGKQPHTPGRYADVGKDVQR